jgi:trk system potassium uptake protein TrkH
MNYRGAALNRLKNISPVRLIVSSFFLIIVAGSILLTLPIASRSGQPTNYLHSFFTATSSTCVTGLVVFDTWTHWSAFGQAVILLMIQLGGLGLVTFTTGFTLFLRRKLGLRDLQIAREYTSGNMMDVPRLIRTILCWTFACEAVGSLLLAIRFIPQFGNYGIWISIFLSVSAYCNAGFDILGFLRPDGSLTAYVNDPLVSLTICMLIIVGGIGFIVVSDIHACSMKRIRREENHPHLTLHTQIVLKTTVILLIIGTAMFLLFEYDNTLRGMNFFQKLHASFFQSVTARTAGYATIDVGSQLDVTKLLTMVLMFIGASPSSTGGGIKTTTFVVLIYVVISVLRGRDETVIARRRVEKSTVYRSLSIVFLALLVVSIATTIIAVAESKQDISAIDALFEAVSAFGTVGLTTGITHLLTNTSLITLIITMFIGRVGPISLILALSIHHNRRAGTILPEGKVIVG